MTARLRLEIERTRLADEVAYLRHQVDKLTEREQSLSTSHADITARAAALETEKDAALARAEELARELASTRAAVEAAEVARREQAASWHAERERLFVRHTEELTCLRDESTTALAQRQDEHARALAQKNNELQKCGALLAAERETVQDLRRTTAGLEVRLKASNDALLEARRTLERLTAELASVAAARDRLVEELQHVHEQYREERKEHSTLIQTLEAQIKAFMENQSALDQRYESLLDVLNKHQHVKAAE